MSSTSEYVAPPFIIPEFHEIKTLPMLIKIGDVFINPEMIEAVRPNSAAEESCFILLRSGDDFFVPLSADEVADLVNQTG